MNLNLPVINTVLIVVVLIFKAIEFHWIAAKRATDVMRIHSELEAMKTEFRAIKKGFFEEIAASAMKRKTENGLNGLSEDNTGTRSPIPPTVISS